MDDDLIFQLVASITATLCSGASLAFWLLYTEVLKQVEWRRKPLIYSQVITGGMIILGWIISMLLALERAITDNAVQGKIVL